MNLIDYRDSLDTLLKGTGFGWTTYALYQYYRKGMDGATISRCRAAVHLTLHMYGDVLVNRGNYVIGMNDVDVLALVVANRCGRFSPGRNPFSGGHVDYEKLYYFLRELLPDTIRRWRVAKERIDNWAHSSMVRAVRS